MKTKFITSIFSALFILLNSCTSDPVDLGSEEPNGNGEEIPPYDFSSMKNGDKLPIYYSEDNGKTFIANYNAVRIGEYLWMNTNFTAPMDADYTVTQDQVNRGLAVYRIDTSSYKLTPTDVNNYIGIYYSTYRIGIMNSIGNMFEGDEKVKRSKWSLPSVAAFKQLFAMCDDGNEEAVRTTLCYKVGEIPIIKKENNIFWIQDANTNKYGFNLIYGGQRAHNDDYPWGVCYDSPNNCVSFLSKKGDFVIFYATAVYPTSDDHTVMLHDWPDTSRGKEWAWKTVRWCRRLTDSEIGYKLYINEDRSDIKKMNLTDTPPSGYQELEQGYLRGFYVQYILDNPNPEKTIAEIVQLAKSKGE